MQLASSASDSRFPAPTHPDQPYSAASYASTAGAYNQYPQGLPGQPEARGWSPGPPSYLSTRNNCVFTGFLVLYVLQMDNKLSSWTPQQTPQVNRRLLAHENARPRHPRAMRK